MTRAADARDELLTGFAAALRDQVRATDHAFRIGGDEFAVVLRGTDGGGARRYVERVREQWGQLPSHPVEFSAGIAVIDGRGGHCALEAADRALYDAKRSGGGTVTAPAPGLGA